MTPIYKVLFGPPAPSNGRKRIWIRENEAILVGSSYPASCGVLHWLSPASVEYYRWIETLQWRSAALRWRSLGSARPLRTAWRGEWCSVFFPLFLSFSLPFSDPDRPQKRGVGALLSIESLGAEVDFLLPTRRPFHLKHSGEWMEPLHHLRWNGASDGLVLLLTFFLTRCEFIFWAGIKEKLLAFNEWTRAPHSSTLHPPLSASLLVIQFLYLTALSPLNLPSIAIHVYH